MAVVDGVVAALRGVRLVAPVDLESDLHRIVGAAFDGAGLRAAHEVRLGPGARVDFAVECGPGDGVVAVEIKRGKPGSAALHAQAARYAAVERVVGVVMVVERSVFWHASEIEGKPAVLVSLTSNWGMSV